MSNEIRNIATHLIDEPKDPMRLGVSLASLDELVASIKQNGLINPITVRREGDRFRVVAGHRRTLACRIAGLADIPCVIANLTDAQADSVMAAENLERKDVDPVEEALFIGKIVKDDATKIPEVAKKLNRSIQWVQTRLDILAMPDYMIQSLRSGEISLGVAQWLARIEDDTYRQMYVRSAVLNGMKVQQAEYYFNLFAAGALKPPSEVEPPAAKDGPNAPAPFSVICVKCGGQASGDNLVSVFIHRFCPAPEEEKPNAGGGRPDVPGVPSR